MIDFKLSPEQDTARQNAAAFAQGVLGGAFKTYSAHPNDGVSRFKATKPIFETATRLGIIKSLVPAHLGGTGGSLLASALITEELFAVEPGMALNLLTISLGLMPLLFSPAPEDVKREILAPFLTCDGAPLAAFQWSEPGGTANYFEKGSTGMQTTARKQGTSWVLNGEKIWAGSSAGWDDKGADVQVIFCRDAEVRSETPEDGALLILVPRHVVDANEPDSFHVISFKETPGFTAHSGPHVAFRNLQIPEKYVIATGQAAAEIVETTFAATGAMVGAMATGIMRSAFDLALNFARSKTQGGNVKVLERQSAADLLIELKMRIKTARLLTWKAAHAMDVSAKCAIEECSEAKIYGSEAAITGVSEAMRVIGIGSWTTDYPFSRLVQEAALLPIFDGGNQGVRRRLIQRAMLAADYDPWADTFQADRCRDDQL